MADLRTRVESVLLNGVTSLPAPVARVLGGRRNRDGLVMAPEAQMLLRAIEIAGEPDVVDPPTPKSRAEFTTYARMVGGRQPIGAIRDLEVAGADGPLAARLYTPTARLADQAMPTMVFFHGGGMAHGGIASHDAPCRFIAEQSGVQLLSVDYRLAPEHRFPAGVRDCIAAYRWLVEHAHDVHADPDRLAVGGDSAGGYYSATTAIQAAEEGLPLKHQLLIYPCTDFVNVSASRETFAKGYYLGEDSIQRYKRWYFTTQDEWADPLASIALRDDYPEGLAPATIITAGFDPLRDEGQAYAEVLRKRGFDVELIQYDGLLHGFINMIGIGTVAAESTREIATLLRDHVS